MKLLAWLTGIPWGLIAFLVVCLIVAGLGIYVRRWQIVLWAVVAAVVGIAWQRVTTWHDSHKALPAVQKALEAEQACGDGSKCAERVAGLQERQKVIDEQTARDYETRIAEIAARPAPAGPIRLCRPANNRLRVPGAAPATGAGQGSDVPLEVGRDIAVELYKLADDADREALKLELLFERDTALATSPAQ